MVTIFSNFRNKANMQLKIFKQKSQIRKLKESNQNLRYENEENSVFRYNARKFLEKVALDMYEIHAINNMNILEHDKKQRIDKSTTNVVNKIAEFIHKNELDEAFKNI